VLEKDGEHQLD